MSIKIFKNENVYILEELMNKWLVGKHIKVIKMSQSTENNFYRDSDYGKTTCYTVISILYEAKKL